MHTRRVKQLVKDLRNTKKTPPGSFTMDYFVRGNPLARACNMSACAAGWMYDTALQHKREFLTYILEVDVDGEITEGFAQHYLDLTTYQAWRLFSCDLHMTQFEKADWIEAHLLKKVDV